MLPLQILFQDESLVAIDKPAGMIVHPGRDKEDPQDIAILRLRDLLGQRVYPVHRLDRPTSGVQLFALDKKSASLTQQAFAHRQIIKTYLAIVTGRTPAHWTCETPLKTNQEDEPLPAITSFERIAVTSPDGFPKHPELILSLLEATPLTGRFHQIRRHLLEAGFPIVGDFRYAGMDRSFELGELLGTGTRMLLQSKSLQLTHPHTNEHLNITAPADPEFCKCFPGIC